MSQKYMPLDEFVEAGYLQEANRQFFHPLGLALEVLADDDGRVFAITGLWDARDDPEGIVYGKGELGEVAVRRAARVRAEWEGRAAARREGLGFVVQPITTREGKSMNQIKPVETPEGKKYELHWEGKVETFDDRASADRALVKKMAEQAGRPATEDLEKSPPP